MRPSWFVRKGVLFIPKHVVGWIVLIAFAAMAVWEFIDIDSRSHSVSDTLINFVFHAAILAVVYTVIASILSKSQLPDEQIE